MAGKQHSTADVVQHSLRRCGDERTHMCGGSCSRLLLSLGQVVRPVLAARHNAQHSILQPHGHYIHASLQTVHICRMP